LFQVAIGSVGFVVRMTAVDAGILACDGLDMSGSDVGVWAVGGDPGVGVVFISGSPT
jgi:hypothetical protein